jgi:ParB family transcriptional regulator, chromosome partitioning protein
MVMTTSAAEKVRATVEKKEEKMEKRRALGRGLESLLPGPRVVSGESRVASVELPSPTVDAGSSGDGGEQQVPRFARNDKASEVPRSARNDMSRVVALDPVTSEEMDARRTEPALSLPKGVSAPHEPISIEGQANAGSQVVNLDVNLIEKNPYQTRYVFDEETLIDMKESILQHGVVQPVVVRPAEDAGRYILVLGERRLRASKMAGKETIPALVRRLSPQQAAEMTVLENVVREDLNPLEQAEAFRVLSKEFHLTQVQIAERIGVSRETVSNYMRLLRLPEEVMGYMLEDRLTFSDAREILRLENEEHIVQVAKEVVTKHLKWDEIEERVMRLNGSLPIVPGRTSDAEKKNRGARWMDPNVRAAQTEMERTLGMRVRISDRNGKGRIVIEYASVDDYERVVELLGKK